MKRRKFLKSGISGTLSASYIGYIAQDRLIPDEMTINVSLFTDQSIRDKFSESDYLDQIEKIKEAIAYSVTDIPDSDQNIDVKFIDTTNIIPRRDLEDMVSEADGKPTMFARSLEHYMDKNVDDKSIATDSNILLLGRDIGSGTVRGVGSIPNTCFDATSVGFAEMPNFRGFNNNDIVYSQRERDSKEAYMITIVHEFGHNIGLTHSMGSMTVNDRENEIITSPMMTHLSSKLASGGSTETFFGNRRPYIDPSNDYNIYTSPTFNEKISMKNLQPRCKDRLEHKVGRRIDQFD